MITEIFFNRYRVKHKVAETPIFQTFEGVDENSAPVLFHFLKTTGFFSRIEDLIFFENQLRKVQSLSFSGLVPVLAVGRYEDAPFVILQKREGTGLKEILKEQNILDYKKSIEIILKILKIIHFLQKNDLTHRGIKPETIYFSEPQMKNPFLTLFGFSYLEEIYHSFQQSADPDDFIYISPEQTGLLRRRVDFRSDLYSLGIVFYELLTGKPPFYNKDSEKLIYQHLSKSPFPPSGLNPQIPEALDKVILNMLKKEPGDRYQNISELERDLREILAGVHGKGARKEGEGLNVRLPLIGRGKELKILEHAVQRAKEKPEIVYIIGKSGMGKSKLGEQLGERSDKNTLYYHFECPESSGNTPFYALSEYLKFIFQNSRFDDLEEKVLKKLGWKSEVLLNLFPFLKASFKGASGEKPSRILNTVKNDREEIFSILEEFLDILFESQKTVLFLDDIQWLDWETFSFILHLKNRKVDYDLLIVLAENYEKIQKKHLEILEKSESGFSLIQLSPIEEKDFPFFVKKALNTEQEFPLSFYQNIEKMTLGNPFHIIEVLKNLTYEKALFHREGFWQVEEDIMTDLFSKHDLYSLLLKRVNHLEEREKELLKVASVIGQKFQTCFLKEVFGQWKGNGNISAILEQSSIVERVPLKAEIEYQFFHGKIREILYAQLEEGERKRIHLICSRKLEEKAQGEMKEKIFPITYHYFQSGEQERFLHFAYLAYRYSLSRYAMQQALFYLKKIVDYFLDHKELNRGTVYQVIELAWLMQSLGEIEESLAYLNSILDFVRKEKLEIEEVDIYIHLGMGYYLLNRMNTALMHYQNAMKIAERQNREITHAHPYSFVGSLYYFQYDLNQAEKFLEKAEKYLKKDHLINYIRTLGVLAWTYSLGGKITRAVETVRKLEEMIPLIQNSGLLAQICHYCSIAYSQMGLNPVKAYHLSRLSYRNSEKSKNALFKYSSCFSQGFSLMSMGEFQKAVGYFDKGIHLSQKNRLSIGIDLFFAFKAVALFMKGDREAAQKIMDSYMEKAIHEKLAVLIFYLLKGSFSFLNGKWEQGNDFLEEAYQLSHRQGIDSLCIFFLRLKEFGFYKMNRLHSGEIRQKEEMLSREPLLKSQVNQAEKWIEILEKELRESEFKLQRYMKIKEKLQLKNLTQLNRSLLSFSELDRFLQEVLEQILELTGAENGFLIMKEKGQWVPAFSSGEEQWKSSRVPEYVFYEMEQTGEGKVVSCMNNQPGNCSEEIYSVIVMPFFLEKKVKGFLYLENKQIKDLFTEKDIEILSMIAGQIALILEKSYLPLGKIQEKAENTDHKNLIEKYEITQREKEIIDLLLEGKTNKAISKELFLSFYTVKTHIYNIYQKTAVKNRVELTNLFGSK